MGIPVGLWHNTTSGRGGQAFSGWNHLHINKSTPIR